MNPASEKSALVLDVGSKLVKCGLSEERAPRCVLRWEVAAMMHKPHTTAEWYAYLSSKLRAICFDHLHVNPRHRRFVVCEELVTPHAFRDALVQTLFTALGAASIALVPAPLAALYATPQHTALVVDCGWREARVLPVFKGIAMPQHYTPIPTGSAACCDALVAALQPTHASLTHADAEDVLERACFVQQQEPINNVVDATIESLCVVPAALRTAAVEHLFVGHDVNNASLVTGLVDVIRKLPVDVRTAMLSNVLLMGGTSMLPGLPQRLMDALQTALAAASTSTSPEAPPSKPSVALVPLHFPRNMLAWVGASIFAATESARTAAIGANEFVESGCRLPDWLSIAPVVDAAAIE